MRTYAQTAAQQPRSSKASVLARSRLGHSREVNVSRHFQRTIGNQAVPQLLPSNAEETSTLLTDTASPQAGHDFSPIPIHPPVAGVIQTKLAIGAPGDKYEQEADRVADQVMGMRDTNITQQMQAGIVQPLRIQRLCTSCSKEGAVEEQEKRELKPDVQAKEVVGQTPQANVGVESRINNLKGGGQPLDAGARAFFEPRFGYDFSHVRVHQGSEAAYLSRSINARAFALGNNLVFGEGEYAPESSLGRSLLAHELTHVIQQGGAHPTIQRSANEVQVNEQQPDSVLARRCEVGPGPFPGDGLAPPGDCSWAEYLPLLAAKESAAAVVNGLGACRGGDSCHNLALKIAAISAEVAARMGREAKCFRGGDRGHRIQICDKVNMMMRCYRHFSNGNCPQELVEAMETVVTAMRAAVVVGAAALTIALVVALIVAIIALIKVIIAALAAASAVAAEAVMAALLLLLGSFA